MKIVFMGTPGFAVPTLEALCQAGHEVGIVVSQPDAAKDRGKKIKFTPVKEKALECGIKVLQPEKIKGNEEFLEELREYSPDVIIVVAYGKLLPKEILDLPRLGCINVHGSLLPKYRGAAPIQRAVLDGEEKTGITIMYMAEGLDTGDMLSKEEVIIGKKTAGELHDELSIVGAKLLVKTLEKLIKNEIHPEKQDESQASYSPMIFKKDGEIDFQKSAEEIERKVRGLSPWPGAYTMMEGKLLKIWQAKVLEGQATKTPGTIEDINKDGITIATGEGLLLAEIIQVPGKKKVKVEDFLKGNKIEKFSILG